MRYRDGQEARLGDVLMVPVPSGNHRARLVMLGDSREHIDIDEQFLAWVNSSAVLAPTSVVIEWLQGNPFAHKNQSFAPVGQYMFTVLDEDVSLVSRAST